MEHFPSFFPVIDVPVVEAPEPVEPPTPPPPPVTFTLIRVSPENVLTTGGETLTITGTGFVSPSVFIGTIPVTPFNVSESSLNVTTPVLAAGTYDITVTVNGESKVLLLAVTAAPSGDEPVIYFEDDFSLGNFTKAQDGWWWADWRNRPSPTGYIEPPVPPPGSGVSCEVFSGWSHLGYTGKSARFRFTNNQAPQTVTVSAPGAAQNATSIPIATLAHGIPAGTVLSFDSGKSATMAATAAIGATSLSVNALAAAIATGDACHPKTQAWSELNFVIGTPGLRELWTRFWVYYPTGTEVDANGQNPGWLGPAFERGIETNSNINDKLFALYEAYSIPSDFDALQAAGLPRATGPGYVVETWFPWNQGGPDNGDLVVGPARKWNDGGRTYRHTDGGGSWDIEGPYPEEVAHDGRWHCVDIGCKVGTGPGTADGFVKHYVDGELRYEELNMDTYVTAEPHIGAIIENRWRAGYLMGYRNSGTPYSQTMYAFISGVQFSDRWLGAPVLPEESEIYFTDDFSTGNFSKTQNGWQWSPPAHGNINMDVIAGFSHLGSVGHCARFTQRYVFSNIVTGWVVAGGTLTYSVAQSQTVTAVYKNGIAAPLGSSPTTLANGEWYWSAGTLYYRSNAGNPDAVGLTMTVEPRHTTDTQAQLGIKCGAGGYQELWITYWSYYPDGTETIAGIAQHLYETGVKAPTDAAHHNKMMRAFDQYSDAGPGYLEMGNEHYHFPHAGYDETENPDRYVSIEMQQAGSNWIKVFSQHDGIPAYWAQAATQRGRWVKREWHLKACSGTEPNHGAHDTGGDGLLELYEDGALKLQLNNRCNWNTGVGLIRQMYFEGYASNGYKYNASIGEVPFNCYISGFTASSARLVDTDPSAVPSDMTLIIGHNYNVMPYQENGEAGYWFNVPTEPSHGAPPGPNLTIVSDASDPTGDGTVIDVLWPAGLEAGWEPCNHGGRQDVEYEEVWWELLFKLLDGGTGGMLIGNTGIKWGFLSYGQDPSVIDNQGVPFLRGNGHDAVLTSMPWEFLQQNITTRNIAANVDTSSIIRVGVWTGVRSYHRMNTSGVDNGLLKMWVLSNNVWVQTHDYSNVRYRAPASISNTGTDCLHGFKKWKFNPTWNGGSTRTRDDHARLARFRMFGKTPT